MFLFPALTIGFLFVAVPLLVHLINMLRHRRQRWAAMDFLLASYRKQKKWIRLRQMLLLLSRLAVAALLIAMLCGWTGGGQTLGILGGTTTHHVVILDDSYSMGDRSLGPISARTVDASGDDTAYGRSLRVLQNLTRRLAGDDGNHQLTIMRASRAALVTRGGSESGDSAADLSAQTITSDARLINRVMATEASSIRTDLIPALDLAAELVNSTPADTKYLYIASDFRKRDWGSAERLAESLRKLSSDVGLRMIDCAAVPSQNLGITSLSPAQDVWVAGVPVVVSVTVQNFSQTPAKNVAISNRVIRYSDKIMMADPTMTVSGEIESLPAIMIDSLGAGEEVTKSFQVFVTEQGTHAIEVALPEDALAIDNVRSCTLPLSDAEKVLVIDADPDARGAYHIAAVLDPGSQVRIGAVPDVQPPSFLRSATFETLAPYRAVYLVDVPEIGENAADALYQYVQRGGGLAWFLGEEVSRESYNQSLLSQDRHLLPAPLARPVPLPTAKDNEPDVVFGEAATMLLAPLQSAGDSAFSIVGLSDSWSLEAVELNQAPDPNQPRVRTILDRRDGLPFVTVHEVGRGRVISVLSGIDGAWTNWPGDPTFVVFLLQSNAMLWSAAAPPTSRFIDDPLARVLPVATYTNTAAYLPATGEPPRVPIEVTFQQESSTKTSAQEQVYQIDLKPTEMAIEGEENIDEVLRPGISEWALNRIDGRVDVVPVASVIRSGEGDLARVDHADIAQQLLPLDIEFVDSNAWSEANMTAGRSTLILALLTLLGLFLAVEQALASWASYHVRANAGPTSGAKSAGSMIGGRV